MKKMLSLIIALALFVPALADGSFVYSTASVTDSANTKPLYDAFYASGQFVLPIPGLTEGLTPQGIAYLPDENWVIVAGYRDDGERSALIALDRQTGEIVKEVHLNNTDGTPYTGHAGGVCATSTDLFISNNEHLYRIPLAAFRALPESSECAFSEAIPVPCRASYCAYADGLVWVGEFQYGSSYTTDRSHRVRSQDGTYRAWILGYRPDEHGNLPEQPECILATDERIQGMTIRDGNLYLSQSYGRRNSSTILRYQDVRQTDPHHMIDLNGAQIPLWCLDSRSQNARLAVPPMTECLCTVDDAVYVLFESGADKYMDPGNPSVNPVDEVFALTGI